MRWKAELHAMEAGRRRQERESKKRQRELERQTKEMAKLSALEQARLEVETYDNALDILLSIHKEQADAFDWLAIAASLPPVPPRRQTHNELKARQRLPTGPSRLDPAVAIEQARSEDEREYQEALKEYEADNAEWAKMSLLARRILAGDSDAYVAAIEQLSPFSELAGIGSSLHFRVHAPGLIEVELSTSGRKAIPAELKTLTASGRVSVKPMPRSRFVEIYQDYVCGCVLRVAREIFALLPAQTLLLAASAEVLDTATGQMVDRPFLSVAISRTYLQALDFDRLDPSDTIMSLPHRGDLKASRKTGDFEFIVPLTFADLSQTDDPGVSDFDAVLASIKRLHADLVAQCAALSREPAETPTEKGEDR
ncbi:MAG: hypothetical protein KJZ78_10270 [Bryobacteraceae bacterium]|nr:hypothetical protein [Bryobacteraceae bacterium]